MSNQENAIFSDKYNIKQQLFTKAIPNYVIPVPTLGHRVFYCMDCGDKFIFETSYNFHVNRKSVRIYYTCRHCNDLRIFYNRCNLLSHIRSHVFKTATINVGDLKIIPLSSSDYPTCKVTSDNSLVTQKQKETTKRQRNHKTICLECSQDITVSGVIYKDRAKHFLGDKSEIHSCPVCLYTLSTECALKAHLRFHLKRPPYFCPECGIPLSYKNVNYPYNHDCNSFKTMRATIRCRCPFLGCQLFHPNFIIDHIIENHVKKMYKCPLCELTCYAEWKMLEHLKTIHVVNTVPVVEFKCELCPGKAKLVRQLITHIKTCHNEIVYPCWTCGVLFTAVDSLLDHYSNTHEVSTNGSLKIMLKDIEKTKGMFSVVKRCVNCNVSFHYKCQYHQIHLLPKDCPYKCHSNTERNKDPIRGDATGQQIICYLCKDRISEDWEQIKMHYAIHHKEYKCVDAQVVLTKLDIHKYMLQKMNLSRRRKRLRKKPSTINKQKVVKSDDVIQEATAPEKPFVCSMCGHQCVTKQTLETHMKNHRDPCMAYQCMECGECFVVKGSFSTHLLLEHGINDVESYVAKTHCFNEDALIKYQDTTVGMGPVSENQCKICRKQFSNSLDYEKHFRIHGMAFLLKNSSSKNSSP